MDYGETPGLIEDVEEVSASIAHALGRFLNRLPFLSKGAFPFIFAPILLLGVFFQARGLWDAARGDFSLLTWKQIPAVVVTAGPGSEMLRSRTGGVSYRPGGLDVRYRYTFNDKIYNSDSFGAGSWRSYSGDSGVSPEDWAKQHPVGSMLNVFVNPSDPEISAVDPGPTLSALVCMLVALPFTLIGLSGVLSDEAQARLSFEGIAVGWCVLILAIYAAGHAVTVGVAVALTVYLLLIFGLHRAVTRNPPSTIEERLDAPPLDVEDFRP